MVTDASATTAPGVTTGYSTDLTAAFTVAVWAKPAATQPDASPTLYAKATYYADSYAGFPFRLLLDGSLHPVVYLSKGDDYTQDAIITAPAALSVGVWSHVAFVYQANGLCTLYVNGTAVASTTINFSISAASSIPWTLGSSVDYGGGAGQSGFSGSLSEAVLYNRAIPAGAVATIAQTGYSGSGATLTATLNATVLAVQAQASSTVAAALVSAIPLAAAAAATASLTTGLQLSIQLASPAQGQSAATADLSQAVLLAGSAASTASVAADVAVNTAAGPKDLSSTAYGVVSGAGTLDLSVGLQAALAAATTAQAQVSNASALAAYAISRAQQSADAVVAFVVSAQALASMSGSAALYAEPPYNTLINLRKIMVPADQHTVLVVRDTVTRELSK
jgi:hypothetical protein